MQESRIRDFPAEVVVENDKARPMTTLAVTMMATMSPGESKDG